MPFVLTLLQSVVEHFANEGIRQPAADLIVNALLGKARLRLGQLRRQPSQVLCDFSQRGGEAVQLLAGEAGRVPEHAEILLAMHQHLLCRGPNAGVSGAAWRKLLHASISQLDRRLIPGQGRDPTHTGLFQFQCVG